MTVHSAFYRLILTIFLLFQVFIVNSQELLLPQGLKSPNSTSLGKYGDVPVSYYTGSPNISIPLYSISELGIPLEISLNYNSSGVRVNDMPGWVGQNWSLEAGGMITRTTKGRFCDEYRMENGYSEGFGYLYSESRNLLNVSNWNTESYFPNLNSWQNGTNDQKVRDLEPDIFTFNFMGFTGKFFIDSDGQWKVFSDSNLKVIIDPMDLHYPFGENLVPFNDNAGPNAVAGQVEAIKNIKRITIIDDNGTKYIFGNVDFEDDNIEYDVPFFDQVVQPGPPSSMGVDSGGRWTANTWYLSKVINRLDKEIYKFTYERAEYVCQFYDSYVAEVFNSYYVNPGWLEPTCGVGSITPYHLGYNGSIISPIYLKQIRILEGTKINFDRTISNGENFSNDPNLVSRLQHQDNMSYPNHLYDFYYLLPYSNGAELMSKFKWYKLTSISGLSKNIQLTYNDTQTTGNNDRLFLKEVDIEDLNYKFDYNDIGGLPEFLSPKTDHWGYFDGSYNFTPTGQITTTNNFSSYYNQKSTHATNVLKGTLKKITYPTNGWTQFVWEPHLYSGYISDDKSQLNSTTNTLAGGTRIKQIIKNDNHGNSYSTDYKYVKGYAANQNSTISSGILESKPKYYFENFVIKSYLDNNARLEQDIFSTTPLLPLGNSFGTHIGYSEVVEKREDNSFKIYNYTSNVSVEYRDEYLYNTLNPMATPYTSFNDRGMLRGKLKEIFIYDSNILLKQKIVNTYDNNNSKYARGVKFKAGGCGNGTGFFQGNAYKLYFLDNNLVTQQSYNYENGQVLKSKIDYNYSYYPNVALSIGDQFLQSKRIQIYSLTGDSDEIFHLDDFKYTFEESSSINNTLVGQRFLGLIQTDSYQNYDKIKSTRIEYDAFGANIFPKRILSAKGNETFEERLSIDEYDADQLVRKYREPNGLYTYVFHIKQYPIIKIEGKEITSMSWLNNKFNEIKSFVTNPSTDGWNYAIMQVVQKQQEIRDYFPNHMVTSYTMKRWVGPNSQTDPRGYNIFYEYNNENRLIKVRDRDQNLVRQIFYNLTSN